MGLPAAHLGEWQEQEEKLTKIVRSLRDKLQQLEISRQKQLVVFQHARRDREILSRIREQRHQAYERDEARKEQKMIDDLFLIQLIRVKK